MKQRDVNINGHNFTLTTLDQGGCGIGIRYWREKIDENHFIIKTVHRSFDKALHYFPHTPIVIGEVISATKFSRKNNIRVLDMPIKFPDLPDYRLPKELEQFDEVIAKMISYEHKINPHVNQYYAYLTVDQMEVPKDTYHRRPGCHTDGFQGARVKYKLPVSRTYISYDRSSPIFYPQGFKTDHLDEATDNFFLSFDEQADETAAITFDPYQILVMGAYTVHKSEKVNYDMYRTFVRLHYDTQVFNRFGNTHNPLFSYNWQMVTSDVLDKLKHKPLPQPDLLDRLITELEAL
jgi:hypothetical protein